MRDSREKWFAVVALPCIILSSASAFSPLFHAVRSVDVRTLIGSDRSIRILSYKTTRSTPSKVTLFGKKNNDESEEDIDISDRDWRAFRAQLVMKDSGGESPASSLIESDDEISDEKDVPIIVDDDLDGLGALFREKETPMSEDNFTPLDPVQWAYDSGHVIEEGAVILGGVEQDFGFGLRQQYFHKSVMLVLDHDENVFTKGIILNRPTDMLLVDDVTGKWRIWYGGDVQNLDHPVPEIVCLHSIPKGDSLIDEVSTTIMNDMKWCSFEKAKMLVSAEKAQPSDFWCFAGYAGWGPGQLMGELNRQSWYMVAADSQTLLKELSKQSALTDPRDAGIDTWELLMTMIGRGETANECAGDFEDLMLKEWAREHLLSIEAGGNAGIRFQPVDVASSNKRLVQGETLDELMKMARRSATNGKVGVGSVLRASSAERSPYLLKDQEFHKSIVLMIGDDQNASVGLILNQPSSKGVEMELIDKVTAKRRELMLPVRFGGQYAIRGQSALIWLHNSPELRKAEVGSPIDAFGKGGIWKCLQEEATAAISNGLAKPSDFLVVSGLSIWIKGERDNFKGMEKLVKEGNYEIIPSDRISDVWNILKRQEALTKMNLVKNLSLSKEAWNAGAVDDKPKDSEPPVTDGVGEGFDEENDSLVFKTDVQVEALSDDALRSWVATFLLGAPSLGA